MSEKDWTFYVHEDGRYASINDGLRGDTLLHITDHPEEAWGDVAKVREFAEWLARTHPVPAEDE